MFYFFQTSASEEKVSFLLILYLYKTFRYGAMNR